MTPHFPSGDWLGTTLDTPGFAKTRLVDQWVEHYNRVRLHSALGYMTPADKLAGRDAALFPDRDRRLEAARARRQATRHGALVTGAGANQDRRA